MASEKNGVVPQVEKIALPIAESLGLRIWDIEFVKEGASWYLRFYIDREGGVSIDDCEAFSRAIDGPLDEADPIAQNYYLEVSSPGIERELRQDWHFRELIGSQIKIRLIRKLENGARELTGTLAAYDDGVITLETDGGQTIDVKRDDASHVRLCDTTDYTEGEE